MALFDDSRLDDEDALAALDPRLRHLASSGARVRRDGAESAEAAASADPAGGEGAERPRSLVVVGRTAPLVRDVVERRCPVPVVTWAGPLVPGWLGGLDLVLALDPGHPEGDEPDATARASADRLEEERLAVAVAVAEAVRRGARVVVAAPQHSLLARHAVGRDSLVLPCESGDPVASLVVGLEHLHRLGLGPRVAAGEVAEALDDTARAASPHRDLGVNPAKVLAVTLAESTPLVWGATSLEADAAHRVAAALRGAAGRPAVDGDLATVLPVLARVRPHDLFEDPLAPGDGAPRPVLLVLDRDLGTPGEPDEAAARAARDRALLEQAALERGVRVEVLAPGATLDAVSSWAAQCLLGRYSATYLELGLRAG